MSESDKAPVTEAINKLKETLKGSDIDAIRADTEALEKAFYAISEKLYKEQGGNPGAEAGPEGGAQAGGDGQTFYGADYEDKTGK